MRILWICNNVLPDFCGEFGLKWNFGAGWVTGLLHAFTGLSQYIIGLCFPIIDVHRMKSSERCGIMYYSFHMDMNDRIYDAAMKDEFIPILRDFNPDIIHIWGTERNHARAVLEACATLGMRNRVVVYIQGIASMMSTYYAIGLTEKVIQSKNMMGIAEIQHDMEWFERWGKTETYVFRNAEFVIGRTEWDKACVEDINPLVKYMSCNEILRDQFYDCATQWNVNHCRRHTIFISQAHYPLKGLHFLLHALSLIINRYPDVEVRIGGFNPMSPGKNGYISTYGQYLLDLMQAYHLQEHVNFLGVLQEAQMIDEYLSANVYVLPSTIDNSPNSVGEAMKLGTPVVASYVGGVPSMVQHMTNGILYPCNEYHMLAHYVAKIFEDDVFASQLSKGGKKTAALRHDPGTVCRRMEEIYHSILIGNKG